MHSTCRLHIYIYIYIYIYILCTVNIRVYVFFLETASFCSSNTTWNRTKTLPVSLHSRCSFCLIINCRPIIIIYTNIYGYKPTASSYISSVICPPIESVASLTNLCWQGLVRQQGGLTADRDPEPALWISCEPAAVFPDIEPFLWPGFCLES